MVIVEVILKLEFDEINQGYGVENDYTLCPKTSALKSLRGLRDPPKERGRAEKHLPLMEMLNVGWRRTR